MTNNTAQAHENAGAPVLNSSVLGEVTWLMAQSDLHREWPIASVMQWVLPALMYNQYRLYRRGGKPVGYVSWARLSAEVETGFARDPSSLQPKDWRSGDRLWLIDWIAPNGGTKDIVRDLKNTVFADEIGRALRWRKGSDTLRIFYLHGSNALIRARDRDQNPTVNLH